MRGVKSDRAKSLRELEAKNTEESLKRRKVLEDSNASMLFDGMKKDLASQCDRLLENQYTLPAC
jgi:hypothetical protein